MKTNALWILSFVALIWAIELLNSLSGHRLSAWGIRPRTEIGLIGILLSPILHGSFNHVLSNTIPFLVLGGLVSLRGSQKFAGVSLFIVVVGGSWCIRDLDLLE